MTVNNNALNTATVPLPLSAGGTNANLTADNGAIFYSSGTAAALLAHTTTASQVLLSGNNAAPTWSTPTYPSASGSAGKVLRADGTNNVYSTATFADTYAINTILYAASANAVSGLATVNNATLTTNSSGVPTWSTTAGVQAWTDVTGTSATMAPNNGYIADNVGLVTLTLPTTAAVGTMLLVQGAGAGGWKIAQNANQIIHIGSSPSTTGATGSVASVNRYDSVQLVCIVANLEWACLGGPQSAGLSIA